MTLASVDVDVAEKENEAQLLHFGGNLAHVAGVYALSAGPPPASPAPPASSWFEL